jgi:hypothetical protein
VEISGHFKILSLTEDQPLLQMKKIHNFDQDDLLTEDVMILDTYSALYVWVGHHTSAEKKKLAFDLAKVGLVVPVAC